MKKKKTRNVTTMDVLSYWLIPDMKVLSPAEKEKVLKTFNIDETQLPRIPADDPAVQALKAEPGNLIRIQRDDGTGKYYAYRIVSGS